MEEKEPSIRVYADARAEEIAPIAKVVNDLVLMPVAMRSKNRKGVRVEKGEIIDSEYSGPVLEQVLRENRVIHTNLLKGKYAGVPVVVAPIRDRKGSAIAALGIFDVVGTVDLGAIFADYPKVLEQVRAYHRAERE
jgi:hypothetical protein